MQIRITFDGKPLTLPSAAKSRTVLMMVLLAILQAYDEFGTQLAQIIPYTQIPHNVVHWTSVTLAILGIYFRVKPKQQLGQPPSKDVLDALREEIKKELEQKP